MSEQKKRGQGFYYVGNKKIKSKDLTYHDCEVLYSEYVSKNGFYPPVPERNSTYNLPTDQILYKILEDNNILMSDWQKRFGKTKIIRSDYSHYDEYLCRYRKICDELGRGLTYYELLERTDLPNWEFFIKYCPDKNVKTYLDFVHWCGYRGKYARGKDEITKELLEKQEELGRPILMSDINSDMFSFSMIVINKIWGGLTNCKKELGMMQSGSIRLNYTLDGFKCALDNCINDVYEKTGRKYISWCDIDSEERGQFRLKYNTTKRYFKKYNINMKEYLKDRGFTFKSNAINIIEYSDEGELYRSTLEMDFSYFLKNELNLKYNVDYYRDVYYSSFTECEGKQNCDYNIIINGFAFYVEIAGFITDESQMINGESSSKRVKHYIDKMKNKIQIFKKAKVSYLILYSSDIRTGRYKEITKQFLGIT